MDLSFTLHLAQAGSEAAGEVLSQSIDLQAGIEASWDEMWDSIIDPEQGTSLWSAIVTGTQVISVLILLYLLVQFGNEFSKTRYLGTLIEAFIWPVTYIIFIGNNAQLLATSVIAIRGILEASLTQVQATQLLGIKIGVASRQVQLNGLGATRIRQLFSECSGLAGDDLETCLASKGEEGQAIVAAIQNVDSSIDTSPLESFLSTALDLTIVGGVQDVGNFFQSGFAGIIEDRAYPLVQTILFGVQWAFLQGIEAALLLTAVLAPVALALSLLPLSGKPIFAWGSAFISLFGVKLGYIVLVGVVSAVMVNAAGNAAEIAGQFGFVVFVSIFSPVIATILAGGGGTALFQGISRRASSITSAASGGISTVLTGGFLGK